MPAKSFYSDYYESGSAAKKREFEKPKRIAVPSKTINIKKDSKLNNKKYLKKAVLVLTIFAMAMLLTYRYNLINEKNLKSQTTKKELASIESSLLTSQIEVEQSTDLKKIEDYAKQQLGMQKPGKNQTIYIDTSKSTADVVEGTTDESFIGKLTNSIKDFFSNIF